MNKIILQQLFFVYIFYIVYSEFLKKEFIAKKIIAKKNFKNLEELKKNIFYTLSSFTYSIVGIFVLFYPIKIHYYQAFYPYFLIAQGFTSYMNDVICINTLKCSMIDITFATYNTIICLLISTYYHLNIFESCILIIGILFIFISNYYFKKNNLKKYIIYHTLWHITIPTLAIYVVYKDYLKN